MLRVVIWHIFLEILAKVKNFLRLSHLYIGTLPLSLFSKAYAYGRIQLNYSDVEGLIPIQTGCIPSKSQQSGIHSDPRVFFLAFGQSNFVI